MSILRREILKPGKNALGELEPETKLIFHFTTSIMDLKTSREVLIDDSRILDNGKPVETIYGKQFKLPIWESCLTAMRIGEICQLTVRDDPDTHYISLNYVITSKCFRKHYGFKPTETHHGHSKDLNDYPNHHCSLSINNSPYCDLNRMINNPPDIFIFTFELVDAIPPQKYIRDIWQMNDTDKLAMIPKLREDGNTSFSDCDYDAAVAAYTRGLEIIESLQLKEKPADSDHIKLEEMKYPFLLNLAQAKLNQGEFYDCIRYTDEVLKKNPTNLKALFRRAKAHAGVWNFEDARNDFKKCMEFDRNMTRTVNKCLQELDARKSLKSKEDREKFGGMFTK